MAMKENLIYTGVLGESLEAFLPKVIDKAIELGYGVYVEWNGVVLYVTKDDTVDGLMNEYYHKLHILDLDGMEQRGDLVTKREFVTRVSEFIWGWMNTNLNEKIKFCL